MLRIIGNGDGDAAKQLLDGTYFATARSLLGSCFGRLELVILPFIDHLVVSNASDVASPDIWFGIFSELATDWQDEYAAGSCRWENAMRTPRTINHILRSQQPAEATDERTTLWWRCQFCGQRFTDRTKLREHLEVERRRQEGEIVP